MGFRRFQSDRKARTAMMTRHFSLFASIAAAVFVAAACSTPSRTERQLEKVDALAELDIPSEGAVPPVKPASVEEFFPGTLVISYDPTVGKSDLLKAVKKFGAEVVYEYEFINAIAVKLPEGSSVDATISRFEKVNGVIHVSKDRFLGPDGGPVPR